MDISPLTGDSLKNNKWRHSIERSEVGAFNIFFFFLFENKTPIVIYIEKLLVKNF